MSTSSPPRVYTSWPQPTAQYGHTDSVASRRHTRAPAVSVGDEAEPGPRPQSIALPTRSSRRSDSNDRGRDPRAPIDYIDVLRIIRLKSYRRMELPAPFQRNPPSVARALRAQVAAGNLLKAGAG